MAYNLGVTLDGIYCMSSKEYFGWIKYFKERPVGWRADHRAAILTQTTYQGKQKLKVEELFPSLQVFKNNDNVKINQAKSFIDKIQTKTSSTNKIKTKD